MHSGTHKKRRLWQKPIHNNTRTEKKKSQLKSKQCTMSILIVNRIPKWNKYHVAKKRNKQTYRWTFLSDSCVTCLIVLEVLPDCSYLYVCVLFICSKRKTRTEHVTVYGNSFRWEMILLMRSIAQVYDLVKFLLSYVIFVLFIFW